MGEAPSPGPGAHLLRSHAALRATWVLVSHGGLSAFRGGRASPPGGLGMLLFQPRFTALKLLLDNRTVVGFDIAGKRRARPDWFAARFPLHEARQAHEMLGAGEARGKIGLAA